MGLGRFLVVKTINAAIVLLVVLIIVTVLFIDVSEKELISSIEDYLRTLKPPQSLPPEKVREWKEQRRMEEYRRYGLDKPKWQRIFYRVRDVLMLNLGTATHMKSFISGSNKVKDIILEALPNTIILFTTAQLIDIAIGLILGLQAARKVGSILDRSISLIAMISYSLPMWWVGMLMLMFFSYRLRWFPSSALNVYEAIRHVSNPLEYIATWAYYMALPLVTVVLVTFGGTAYVTRNIVVGVLQEDFVMAARAKGIPERKVLYGHVLRTASPPIVTMSALSIIGSLGGAIITETVFTWPGMGRVYWIALQQSETGVLIGTTFISVFLFVVTLIILDIVYGILDPRVRVG